MTSSTLFDGSRSCAWIAAFLCIFSCLNTPAIYANDTAPEISLSDSKIQILDNGLEVLLLPDAASDLVTVISIIKAGSAYESPRLSGAAHFLEHMLFNGTNRRTQAELYAAEDAAGGFNNAFTRKTHAAFMLTMPSIELDLALDLQSDMLFNSRLPNHKFEKERGIILEEMAKDKESAGYELNRILNRDLYPESSYGLPVLGTELTIATLSRGEVMKFYKALYNPENITLVILGGFEEASAISAIESTFGVVPNRGSWPMKPSPPASFTCERTYHHKLATENSYLRVAWNGPDPMSDTWLAARIAADITYGSNSSALARGLNEVFPEQIVNCSGSLEAGFGFSRFVIDLEVTRDTDLKRLATVLLEYAAEGTDPLIHLLDIPTPESLEGWKTSAYADEIFSRQRSYMYAPLTSEAVALQGARGLEGHLERVADVTWDQVVDASTALVSGPHLTIAIESTLPLDTDEPDEDDGMMAGGMASDMPAAMAKQMKAMSASSGGNRVRPLDEAMAEKADAAIDRKLTIHQADIDSGVKLISIDTPSDGSISIYVMIEGRNYLEPAGKEGITELTHQLLTAGTTGLNESELSERLAAIGGSIQCGDRGFIPFDDYYTGRDFSFIRLQALDMYAAEAFELLAEIIGSPRFPESVVTREKNKLIARLRQDRGSARSATTSEMRAMLYGPDHPLARSPYGTVSGVESIVRDDIVEFHRLLFDPRRCWIGVVSGLPLADQERFAADLIPENGNRDDSPTLGMEQGMYDLWLSRDEIGQLAANRLTEFVETASIDSKGVVTREIQTGGEGRGRVVEMLLLPEREILTAEIAGLDNDLAAVLGVAGSIISADLAFELRERRGLAYGIGAGISAIGDRWIYTASAGTRVDNLSEMAAGFTSLRTEAGDESETTVRRIAQKRYGRTLRRQSIRLNQAMYSVWNARDGKDPGDWWREARQGRNVSAAAVNQAVKLLSETSPSVLFIAQ
jgi:zinc protease